MNVYKLLQQQQMLNSGRAQLVRGSISPDLTVSAAQSLGFSVFVIFIVIVIIDFFVVDLFQHVKSRNLTCGFFRP